MIPAKSDNPGGLHQRYNVTKADGEPVDPNAVYFVLRLDNHGRDPVHLAACRAAARVYAGFVQSQLNGSHHLHRMGRELMALVDEIDPPSMAQDKFGGFLQVGFDPSRDEVVVNLDYDRTGHIAFSADQARQFAAIIAKKADELAEFDE